ncbi:hypothetical protein JOF53_002687 [Crossiella equi]|uniref:Uncharacterized protein n=1 Tax=Crossiella equi TaxID=130796 RepID=A0ABS5ADP0_9PSEU|nr:hypothetical protein [Crossiella equi]MBP2473815.1 hypothetical protein [Crossiella equi]
MPGFVEPLAAEAAAPIPRRIRANLARRRGRSEGLHALAGALLTLSHLTPGSFSQEDIEETAAWVAGSPVEWVIQQDQGVS